MCYDCFLLALAKMSIMDIHFQCFMIKVNILSDVRDAKFEVEIISKNKNYYFVGQKRACLNFDTPAILIDSAIQLCIFGY